MSDGLTNEEILEEIKRRCIAARALGVGPSYIAALNDLAGWVESELDQRKPKTKRKVKR